MGHEDERSENMNFNVELKLTLKKRICYLDIGTRNRYC